MIEFVAHPSVKHITCEYDGYRETSYGFCVKYIFHWEKDNGDRHYTGLLFKFDDNAKIVDIEPEGQSNIIPPFIASDFIGLITGSVLDEMLKDTTYTSSDLKKILDKGGAKELLTLVLRAKQE